MEDQQSLELRFREIGGMPLFDADRAAAGLRP